MIHWIPLSKTDVYLTILRKIEFYSCRCSTEKLPFYQVRGLPKSVFLANVGSESTTVVSFNGGVAWNRTHYECDKVF